LDRLCQDVRRLTDRVEGGAGSVERSGGRGVLPLRPMTIGELLDTALVLFRTRAWQLLGLGLVLATAEQALLYPLREAAQFGTDYIPRRGHVAEWWAAVATGFGTEAAILAILGGLAAGAALPALLGRPVPRPRRRRGAIAAGIGTVAVVVGLACAAGITAFGVPWLIMYGVLGLAAPAVVVDRRGPGGALLRSLRLVFRSALRPAIIRLLGYLGWLMFRLALGLGAQAVLSLIPGLPGGAGNDLLPIISWLLVNTLAYPILACLDVVLHLEARMRAEGLDITLGQALRRHEPIEPALAVP
jgi:MFS family permease